MSISVHVVHTLVCLCENTTADYVDKSSAMRALQVEVSSHPLCKFVPSI